MGSCLWSPALTRLLRPAGRARKKPGCHNPPRHYEERSNEAIQKPLPDRHGRLRALTMTLKATCGAPPRFNARGRPVGNKACQSRSVIPTKSFRGTLVLLHEHGIIAGRCWPDAGVEVKSGAGSPMSDPIATDRGGPRQIDMIDGICAKERGGHEAFARSHLKEGGRHRLT
jgi:hypothetical protein